MRYLSYCHSVLASGRRIDGESGKERDGGWMRIFRFIFASLGSCTTRENLSHPPSLHPIRGPPIHDAARISSSPFTSSISPHLSTPFIPPMILPFTTPNEFKHLHSHPRHSTLVAARSINRTISPVLFHLSFFHIFHHSILLSFNLHLLPSLPTVFQLSSNCLPTVYPIRFGDPQLPEELYSMALRPRYIICLDK